MFGDAVGYQTAGFFTYDNLEKAVMEYFSDPGFSDRLSPTTLKRLNSGEGTEADVKAFLESVANTDEYREMNYPLPGDFVKRVKENSDKSYTGRASDRSRNGTGVPEEKRGFMDRIHEYNSRNNNAGSE